MVGSGRRRTSVPLEHARELKAPYYISLQFYSSRKYSGTEKNEGFPCEGLNLCERRAPHEDLILRENVSPREELNATY